MAIYNSDLTQSWKPDWLGVPDHTEEAYRGSRTSANQTWMWNYVLTMAGAWNATGIRKCCEVLGMVRGFRNLQLWEFYVLSCDYIWLMCCFKIIYLFSWQLTCGPLDPIDVSTTHIFPHHLIIPRTLGKLLWQDIFYWRLTIRVLECFHI